MLNKKEKEEIKNIVDNILEQKGIDYPKQLAKDLKEKDFDIQNKWVALYIANYMQKLTKK